MSLEQIFKNGSNNNNNKNNRVSICFTAFEEVFSDKLKYLWKIHMFKRKYNFKFWMFQCHIRFEGGQSTIWIQNMCFDLGLMKQKHSFLVPNPEDSEQQQLKMQWIAVERVKPSPILPNIEQIISENPILHGDPYWI